MKTKTYSSTEVFRHSETDDQIEWSTSVRATIEQAGSPKVKIWTRLHSKSMAARTYRRETKRNKASCSHTVNSKSRHRALEQQRIGQPTTSTFAGSGPACLKRAQTKMPSSCLGKRCTSKIEVERVAQRSGSVSSFIPSSLRKESTSRRL